jgi:YjbE family integral membrane protein
MFAVLSDPETWTALFKIAVINVVLSGDNAVVIALACRSLPPKQQRNAFLVGTGGIVVLMTGLTASAALLMTLPYIQIIGSVLLLWIGVKLLLPEDDEGNVKDSDNFWEAVKTIIIADIVMSLDNVLAIAAAAHGDMMLIVFGLTISIPLIVAGATLIMALLTRFPILVWAGAGLLGWIAGELMVEDPISGPFFDALAADYGFPHKTVLLAMHLLCTLLVLLVGWFLMRRRSRGAVGVPGHEGGPAE